MAKILMRGRKYRAWLVSSGAGLGRWHRGTR